MSGVIRLSDGNSEFLAGWQNAVKIRDERVVPSLKSGETVVLDFSNVHGTTQSWMNALVMGTLLECGMGSLSRMRFSNCSPLVVALVRFAVTQAEQKSKLAA